LGAGGGLSATADWGQANSHRHPSSGMLRSTSLPVKNSPDDRSPLALAMGWVSRITTICLEMVLPALLGYWADQWLKTKMLFLVLGVIVGFSLGMWHLIKLAAAPPGDGHPPRRSSEDE